LPVVLWWWWLRIELRKQLCSELLCADVCSHLLCAGFVLLQLRQLRRLRKLLWQQLRKQLRQEPWLLLLVRKTA